jgi:hypothetical protein
MEMTIPTEILFVRQHHEAKRAGIHKDYRVVIGDKAFSWASRKDFPDVGKPTILWEQPVHDRTYATTPDIVIPDGQYGAGTQVIDYAQKGNAVVADDAYHLELNNGDRFLIKKAPEHYGEKAWLFLRKKPMSSESNKYLEKVAEKKKSLVSPGSEMLGGALLAAGHKRIPAAVGSASRKAVEKHRAAYMAKAHRAGEPLSKPFMEVMNKGAKGNVRRIAVGNALVKGSRTAGWVGGGLILHSLARSSKEGMDNKANVYLEKVASSKDRKRDNIHGWTRAGAVIGSSLAAGVVATPVAHALTHAVKKGWESPSSYTEADVKSYVKAKNVRHATRSGTSSYDNDLTAHYHPPGINGYKRPNVHAKSPTTALHEYGHAHSFNRARKAFGRTGTKLHYGSIIASQKLTVGIGGLAGAYAATSDNDKARKYAPAAVAASTVPLLVEEARASLSPAKHLWKTRGRKVAGEFLKKMAPAYGTYLAAAGTAVGTASIAKHFKNRAIEKANK